MLRMGSILAPVDFSNASRATVEHAAALAQHFHAELFLLHVIPMPNFSFAAYGSADGLPLKELLDARRTVCSEELKSFASEFEHNGNVQCQLYEGDPAGTIVEFAHALAVDAIVLATRGCGLFRRSILGSVTAKVLHDVACPVWTGVHVELMKPWPCCEFRTIVCAVDGDPRNARGLEWAALAAREFRARLVIVHALPSLQGYSGRGLDDGLRNELTGAAKERIAEAMAAAGVRMAEVRIEGGNVSHVVSTAADREKADLVVIGRSSEAGLVGGLRANAYSIIRESPCPVVSV